MPLAIDIYCGLGGWTEGLMAEGYDVVGFDIEQHVYGDHRYPAQLVIQDALTLHGSQFKDADLIVASPPCTEYSYMAMPWSRAKQIKRALEGKDEFPEGYKGSRTVDELNALFDACFRIQREACEAAGRHIPMVVENVRGAQTWVGRAAWNYGSFYLWGDVPALMPSNTRGKKIPSFNGRRTDPGNGERFTSLDCGTKQGGDWFNAEQPSISRMTGSKSPARKYSRLHPSRHQAHSSIGEEVMTTLYNMLREASGLSQQEAADFHGVSLSSVNKWCRGARNAPPGVEAEMCELIRDILETAKKHQYDPENIGGTIMPTKSSEDRAYAICFAMQEPVRRRKA